METAYTTQDNTDVSSVNGVWVDQAASGQYAIHEFKGYAGAETKVMLTCVCKTDLAPTSATVYLQIYNRNSSNWETLTSNDTASAGTNFTLRASVADLTNYKDSNTVVACRVYQLVP